MNRFFEILLDVFQGLLEVLADSLELVVNSLFPQNKNGYHDEFSDPQDFLSRRHQGFTINGSPKGRVSTEISNKHTAIIGPSGAGKTTTHIIPNILMLLQLNIGIVTNDISGEIHDRTSGFAKAQGKTIWVFDPDHPETSDYFNPLAYAETSAELSHIAHLLIKSNLEGGKQDSFWTESAEMLLYLILSIQKEQPEAFQNLFNTRYLVNQITITGKKTTLLDELFSRTKNKALYEEYKALVYGADSKLLANVVSTVKASLRILNDENIALLTSKNTISFSELRKGNVILYLKIPGLSADRLRPITSLMIELCFGTLMSKLPDKVNDRPVAFILDEISSMVLSLESVLSTSRKYGIWILYALQHPNQLEMRYGKYQSASILQNTFTKIYLSGQGQDVAQQIQSALGFTDFIDEDNNHKRTMPLRTARQIALMKRDKALVFIGNQAFETKLHPYYKQKRMRRLTEIPPAPREQSATEEPPALLTAKDIKNNE